MTISATILLVTIFVNALLGLSVYIQSKRDRSTFSFFMIITSVFLWAMPLLLYGLTNVERVALNLSRLSYFAAAMSALALLNFAIGFAKQSLPSTKKIIVRMLNTVTVICFAWLSTSNLLLTGHSVFNSVRTITFGPAYSFYVAFITLAFFAGLFIIGFRHKKETDIVTKKQFLLIFFGILVAIVGGFITNLIFPTILNDFSLYWLGPVFTLVMIGFFTISILKYQLFKLKIIATQLFMFLLWISLLIYVASPVTDSIWYKIITLLATISIGILIIRSTINDVKRETREKEKEIQHRKEVEEFNQSQESFIHLISHEVKDGLGKASNVFAEIVEGTYDSDPKLLKETAGIALKEVRRVIGETEDVLNATNFKTGKVTYDMQPFDFREALMESVNKYRPEAETKGLKFDVQIKDGENYTAVGDRGFIVGHLLKNLMANAITYTPSGGITISLSRLDKKIRFLVKDTGKGLTPKTKAILFTEGGRGEDSLKVNVHATGRGLFITKQIVLAHHGKIWAESEGEDKGSTFFVDLPAGEAGLPVV